MRALFLVDTWNYRYKNLKKLLGFLIPISFLTIFCISMFIPKYKNVAISSMEFFVELLLVTNLVSCVLKYKKNKYQSLDIIFLTMSMLSLFIADTVYRARGYGACGQVPFPYLVFNFQAVIYTINWKLNDLNRNIP